MNTAADVVDEKSKQLVTAAQNLVSSLGITAIRSPFEYEKADAFVRNVKAKYNEIEAQRVYMKEPVLEQGRRIDAFFKPVLDLLKKAETDGKKLQIAYELEQKRIAEEQRKQAEEEARKQREALEAKARQEREEADRKAAELRAQAAEMRQSGDEVQANILTGQAITLVNESEEKAEEVMTAAAQVVALPVAREIPIIEGNSTRELWRARVVNAALVPDMFKVVDDKLVQDYAKRTKGANPVPGLEFYPDYIKSSRSR